MDAYEKKFRFEQTCRLAPKDSLRTYQSNDRVVIRVKNSVDGEGKPMSGPVYRRCTHHMDPESARALAWHLLNCASSIEREQHRRRLAATIKAGGYMYLGEECENV